MSETTEPTIIIRYPNQSGALVLVREHPDVPSYPYDAPVTEYSATCTGCLDRHSQRTALEYPRTWASQHALDCRALPQPETSNQ